MATKITEEIVVENNLEGYDSNSIERVGFNFTQIPNGILRDDRFNTSGVDGLRAFRLLCIMYAKPDSWRFFRRNLAKELNVTEKTLDKATSLLKQWGYLEIIPTVHTVNEGLDIKSSSYVWRVYAHPMLKVDSHKLGEGGSPTTGEGVSPTMGERGDPKKGEGTSPTTGEHSKTYHSKTNNNNVTSAPAEPKQVEEKILQDLLNIYNENCGRLPRANLLSNGRKKKLRSVVKEFGAAEALSLVQDATSFVRELDWWITGGNRASGVGYGLDNLLSGNHLVNYAEKFRLSKKRKEADNIIPF